MREVLLTSFVPEPKAKTIAMVPSSTNLARPSTSVVNYHHRHAALDVLRLDSFLQPLQHPSIEPVLDSIPFRAIMKASRHFPEFNEWRTRLAYPLHNGDLDDVPVQCEGCNLLRNRSHRFCGNCGTQERLESEECQTVFSLLRHEKQTLFRLCYLCENLCQPLQNRDVNAPTTLFLQCLHELRCLHQAHVFSLEKSADCLSQLRVDMSESVSILQLVLPLYNDVAKVYYHAKEDLRNHSMAQTTLHYIDEVMRVPIFYSGLTFTSHVLEQLEHFHTLICRFFKQVSMQCVCVCAVKKLMWPLVVGSPNTSRDSHHPVGEWTARGWSLSLHRGHFNHLWMWFVESHTSHQCTGFLWWCAATQSPQCQDWRG